MRGLNEGSRWDEMRKGRIYRGVDYAASLSQSSTSWYYCRFHLRMKYGEKVKLCNRSCYDHRLLPMNTQGTRNSYSVGWNLWKIEREQVLSHKRWHLISKSTEVGAEKENK